MKLTEGARLPGQQYPSGSKLDPTWYVRETLLGAFPYHVPVENRWVASLYIESGTHATSEAAVVAGFVSNVTEWNKFSEKWHQVLTEYSLDFFHMSEFESRKGPFIGWTEVRKRELLNKLLSIINEHTFWSVGCIVRKHQFDSILSSVVKEICGDVYGVATLLCWRHLGLRLQGLDAWMVCFMEFGAPGSGVLQNLAREDSKIPEWRNEHLLFGLGFRNKRDFLPLQAADILAYELYKQSSRLFGNETRPIRYPLKELGSSKNQWHYMQEAHIRELNDDLTRQIGFWTW